MDRLLLTGRPVVIFDGLDELLDASRRADVATRVERFCSEYPLARVLVTSRLVGYDQARLDDRQFAGYRLGGFGDEQINEYARKWFAQEEDIPTDEAERWADAFLDESSSILDLRANPLLLSLMCILYREKDRCLATALSCMSSARPCSSTSGMRGVGSTVSCEPVTC